MAPRLTLYFSCVERFKSSVILHFNSVVNSRGTAANNTESQHTINTTKESVCRNEVKKHWILINNIRGNTEQNDDLEMQTLQ